ncbi:hypothetical protein GN316_18250 [Xylophilus sp. Kf1]|nr:hypothetical protein [Xylophilus sp. Kf1]
MSRGAALPPVAPVFEVAEALENPFVHERGGVAEYRYGEGEGRTSRLVANPIRVPGVALPQNAAPRMGQDNDALLREAGFDDDAIARLRALGVIADRPATELETAVGA